MRVTCAQRGCGKCPERGRKARKRLLFPKPSDTQTENGKRRSIEAMNGAAHKVDTARKGAGLA